MPDYRSKEAAEYRKLDRLKAWKDRRLAQLLAHPWCAWCEAQGRVTGATVADHIEPHRGDPVEFFHGDLQSLCASCHSSAKQRQERSGWDSACDLDGYPIDPAHPANRLRVLDTH